MPTIPISVTEQGLSNFDKVTGKINGIAAAEKKAGEAAALRVKAQNGGSVGNRVPGNPMHVPALPGPHQPHPGSARGHSPFMRAIHAAGHGVGGAFGQVAHRGGALGALASIGPFGAALAIAGLSVNAFLAATEQAAQRVKEVAERTHEYGEKIFAAGETLGKRGLETGTADASGVRQLQDLGTLEAFKKQREKGYSGSAEDFASMGTSSFRWKAALTAQGLGLNAGAASKLAANLPMGGYNAVNAGRGIAQEGLGRNISDKEFWAYRDREQGSAAGQVDAIAKVQGKTSNIGLENLASGKGLGTANKDYAQAMDPEGFARAELEKESQRKADMFSKMSEAAGGLSEFAKNLGLLFGGQGSYANQGRVEQVVGSAALSSN